MAETSTHLTADTSAAEVIGVARLSFAFDSNQNPVVELSHWSVLEKERVFLYGESGSGKSTLLRLLAGILQPQSGTISIGGTQITSLSARHRDQFRAQHIGLVFQQLNLIPYLSVMDNILLAAKFGGNVSPATLEKATGLLESINLETRFYRKMASHLSHGQQQRVAIVRALINAPSLLLMDEPTSALDTKNRDTFLGVLLNLLQQQPCTLVFVSHDAGLAANFTHRVQMADLNVSGPKR